MNKRRNDYSKLESKVFLQILLITVVAGVTACLLRYILRGHIGDRIVRFLVNIFHFSVLDALRVYQLLIRNNMEIILSVTIIFSLVIIFRFFVSWFTRYFDEISAGMDKLVEESDDEIVLSPELNFMEKNLTK